MGFVVLDLEATCWDQRIPRDRMETIEIGAVRLGEDGTQIDEFQSFVRPAVEPKLSSFCTDLTSITQAEVDAADPFSMVFPRFLQWSGEARTRFCSWGWYDIGQLQLDCARHGVTFPPRLEADHINLKSEFARVEQVRRMGMARALERLGMPLEGTLHRGIDDARNIARIFRHLLPNLPAA